MPASTPNRWGLAAAAILMQVCLGILYSWAVFRGPLAELHGWDKTVTIAPYRWSILFFTLAMIVAGYWQDRVGPRLVGGVGGFLLGTGCLLAAFFGDTPGRAQVLLRRHRRSRRGFCLRHPDCDLRQMVSRQARSGRRSCGDGFWRRLAHLRALARSLDRLRPRSIRRDDSAHVHDPRGCLLRAGHRQRAVLPRAARRAGGLQAGRRRRRRRACRKTTARARCCVRLRSGSPGSSTSWARRLASPPSANPLRWCARWPAPLP